MRDVESKMNVNNQESSKWIFDVLYDIRKFASANNLNDLANELLVIERKYVEDRPE